MVGYSTVLWKCCIGIVQKLASGIWSNCIRWSGVGRLAVADEKYQAAKMEKADGKDVNIKPG